MTHTPIAAAFTRLAHTLAQVPQDAASPKGIRLDAHQGTPTQVDWVPEPGDPAPSYASAHARLQADAAWADSRAAFGQFLAAWHAHPVLGPLGTTLSLQVRAGHAHLSLDGLRAWTRNPTTLPVEHIAATLARAERVRALGPAHRALFVELQGPAHVGQTHAPLETLHALAPLWAITHTAPPPEPWAHAGVFGMDSMPTRHPPCPRGAPWWGISTPGAGWLSTIQARTAAEAVEALMILSVFTHRSHHTHPATVDVWAVPPTSTLVRHTRLPM